MTRGQVEALAGFGVCHEDIGLVIGIDDETLRRWYRHELDTGKAKANAKMPQNIFQKALGTGPQAATPGHLLGQDADGLEGTASAARPYGQNGDSLPGTSVHLYGPGSGSNGTEAWVETTRERIMAKIHSLAESMAEDRVTAKAAADEGASLAGPQLVDGRFDASRR